MVAKGKKDRDKIFRYTRIACIYQVRTANIIAPGGYIIATISEEKNDAGEFDWVIKVDWDNWKKAGCPHISGIDEDLRLDEYILRAYIPPFVQERTLPEDKEGLYEELEKMGLTWYDRFEYMCRTHGKCDISNLTVERRPEDLNEDGTVKELYKGWVDDFEKVDNIISDLEEIGQYLELNQNREKA